jgi:3-hydroxyacyl-[acyl-carrier-protein] dehydratase
VVEVTTHAARPTPAGILAAIPHRAPFRFIDEILEVDEHHIVAAYRFPEDADFYRGHFPGNPITPGVILLETMAQAAVVAHGIYLVGLGGLGALGGDRANTRMLTLFTEATVEFTGLVRPGQRVVTRGEKKIFRRNFLRASAEMRVDDGTVVCSGTLAGMGVPA